MQFLRSIAFLAMCATTVAADEEQTPSKAPKVRVLMARDIEERFDGKPARVTMLEVTWNPGGFTPAHRHPGPTFVYVVEGSLETKVGAGPLRRLESGDTLFEPTMALHRITRNPSGSQKTRIIAIHIHPRDAKQLLIPVTTKESRHVENENR